MTITHPHALEVTLPSDLEIRITRTFDASADLVFEVWTTPELVERWWGCDETPMTVCEIDLRVGGSWRHMTRGSDGMEFGFHGVYQEVDAPNRLVYTEVFELVGGDGALNTLELTEHPDGTTTLVNTTLHTCQEHRDMHVNSGMEVGLVEVLNRFDDVLAGLPATR